MPLHDLPPEILLYLTTHLTLTDAKSLRLTNKLLAHLACERVFSRSLRVLRLEATADSARRVGGILSAGEDLKALVRGLVMRSCCADLDAIWPPEGDWRGKPGWNIEIDDDDDDDDAGDDVEDFWSHEYGYMYDVCPVLDGFEHIPLEVSRLFNRTLGRIGEFARLNWVKVDFNRWTKPPDLSPKGWNGYEYKKYRNTILRKVFRALNYYDHSAGELRVLAIINLHELVDLDIMTSNDFKAVMARLDTLELSMAGSEHNDELSSGGIKAVEAGKAKDTRERILQLNDERTRRAFFPKTLRKYWLEPVQKNLVCLKLYSAFYWGYHPTCVLRGVYFPSLKSLALNKWTFTHAWQFHWILSHGDTLTILTLDNCPIVHDVFVASELDDEGYPVIGPAGSQTNSEKRPVHHRTYSARWHEFFRTLKAGLPRLKRFAFESSADDDGPLPSGQISPFSPTGWPGPHDDLGYYPEDDRLSDSAVGAQGYSPQSPSYSPVSPGYQPTSPPLQGLDSPPPVTTNDSPSRSVLEGGCEIDESTQHQQRIHVSFTPGDAFTSHLPARLHPHRYIVFDSESTRQSVWVKPWGSSEGSSSGGIPDGNYGRAEGLSRKVHEECREEDQRALEELLVVVKGRGRVGEWGC